MSVNELQECQEVVDAVAVLMLADLQISKSAVSQTKTKTSSQKHSAKQDVPQFALFRTPTTLARVEITIVIQQQIVIVVVEEEVSVLEKEKAEIIPKPIHEASDSLI
jgi:hypothetical protein